MKTKILLLSTICISIISIRAIAAAGEADRAKKESGRNSRGRVSSNVSTGSGSSGALRIRTPNSKDPKGLTYGFLG